LAVSGRHALPLWLPSYRVVAQGKTASFDPFWQHSQDASGVETIKAANLDNAQGWER
jgi:hypothetical protein